MKALKISQQITNRENISLDKYLQEIGKVSLITIDEEVNLAKRIRGGDGVALEKLTKANLRFVVSVAKQYQNRGLSLNDLINEGNVGLIKAGLRFDETRGFKFISYAVWWIRQSIIQAIAETSRVVRLPLNRIGAINKIARTHALLEQRLERDPTDQELADCLDLNSETITDTLRAAQRSVSTDAPTLFDDQLSFGETLSDENAESPDASLMDAALKTEIQRVLQTLSHREMEIIVLSFGLNNQKKLTLEEIGERFSVTRERVRQIKDNATKQLRKSFRSNGLKSYLG